MRIALLKFLLGQKLVPKWGRWPPRIGAHFTCRGKTIKCVLIVFSSPPKKLKQQWHDQKKKQPHWLEFSADWPLWHPVAAAAAHRANIGLLFQPCCAVCAFASSRVPCVHFHNQADFPFYASATVSTIWWLLSASYLGWLSAQCTIHSVSTLHYALHNIRHTKVKTKQWLCAHRTIPSVCSPHQSLVWPLYYEHCSLHIKLYYVHSALNAQCTLLYAHCMHNKFYNAHSAHSTAHQNTRHASSVYCAETFIFLHFSDKNSTITKIQEKCQHQKCLLWSPITDPIGAQSSARVQWSLDNDPQDRQSFWSLKGSHPLKKLPFYEKLS